MLPAVMPFSRINPSPRYLELVSLYRQMHQHGETFLGLRVKNTFRGSSLDAQLGRIKALITRTDAQTILDYGCGKGGQYQPRELTDGGGGRWPSVLDYWDIGEIACYDPACEPHDRLPEGKYDGVISTDVLEHCPEEDLPWIIEEIFGYATRFVFANVACYPALKRLPNGENAHCTIKPVPWWQDLVCEVAVRHPEVRWEFRLLVQVATADGTRITEQTIVG